MPRAVKVLAFAGATRRDSYNKKLVDIAAEGARAAGAEVTLVDLRDFAIPLYDGDLEKEEGLPPASLELRKLFHANDALLVATPEYNGSYSAVLKNAIDWVSRPNGDEPGSAPFKNKTAGLLATSPGMGGGMRSLAMTRQLLTKLFVTVIPQECSVPKAGDAFDEDGSLKDSALQARAEGIGATLVQFTGKLIDRP